MDHNKMFSKILKQYHTSTVITSVLIFRQTSVWNAQTQTCEVTNVTSCCLLKILRIILYSFLEHLKKHFRKMAEKNIKKFKLTCKAGVRGLVLPGKYNGSV